MAVTWKEIIKGSLSTGSSTGIGAVQIIAHGLGAVPDGFWIAPTASGASCTTPYVDATNLYVTVTSGKAFKWACIIFG